MSADVLSAIDLFCGAGGLSKGLQWAGFDILWAIDSNESATSTYSENLPGVDCSTRDITETEFPDLETDLDLVAGGPPCPPFSKVGRSKINSLDGRNATEDERVQLWKRLRDAVDHYEPRAFLMENVPGMASAKNDGGASVLRIISDEFRELGYEVRSQKVDAANFGVPQHRERLFIMGTMEGTRPPDLTEWQSHREGSDDEYSTARLASGPHTPEQGTLDRWTGNPDRKNADGKPGFRESWVTVAEAISDLPPLSPSGDQSGDPHPPARADEYYLPPVTEYQKWAREGVDSGEEDDSEPVLHNHEARYHNMKDLSIYSLLGAGTSWRIGDLPDEIQPYRADVFEDNYTKQRADRPSSTIPAHLAKDGHMHIHPHQARSFTVREAARLQSFPDRFVFEGPRTQAYRQVGNAVPPLLAESIGNGLRSVLSS